jgi:hypothetical protein
MMMVGQEIKNLQKIYPVYGFRFITAEVCIYQGLLHRNHCGGGKMRAA